MKSFMTRVISGAVLLALLIGTGLVGGPVLFAFTLFISLIGYWEFLKVFRLEKDLLGILGEIFVLLYYGSVFAQAPMNIGVLITIGYFMALMAVFVFTFPRYQTGQIMASFFGFCYVPVLLSFLYLTRMLPVEGEVTGSVYWLIFICSWGCDTCAYVVGMLIGKHKLAPVLSPKKSVEGAIGGTAGAAILGYIYGVFFTANPLVVALLCGGGAVVSQIGDLAASAIKRNHEIKDYGKLIPGHGGILDRFDSVIFTAPIIYFLAALFWG